MMLDILVSLLSSLKHVKFRDLSCILVYIFRFQVGEWVKFKRSVKTPAHGWQGARHGSVGFVQYVQNSDNLDVSFCTGLAHVLANEVIKVLSLERGQLVRLKADIEKPRFDALL